MIAALYVETGGAYFNVPGVDPWDASRDARNYNGPHPVVAHPPCERWGRYWYGGPSVKVRRKKGDDGGCFRAALEAVRRFGGVLEHPEGSAAWSYYGLIAPNRSGGWEQAGDFTGWTCCVEQGHYGHAARKATWLYASGIERLPELKWGKSAAVGKLEESFRTKEAAIAARRAPGFVPVKRLSRSERLGTPAPFRDVLLELAEWARRKP